MWRDSRFGNSVIAGLIVWLVTIIIFPRLAKLVGLGFDFLSTTVLAPLIDHLYSGAALGTRDVASFMLFALAMFVLVGLALGPWTVMLSEKRLADAAAKPESVERARRVSRRGFMVATPILVLGGFLLLVVEYADFQMNTSFQQRVTILAPVLSQLEEEKLRAEWAAMQTRRDFERINADLEHFARAHGISLPPC